MNFSASLIALVTLGIVWITPVSAEPPAAEPAPVAPPEKVVDAPETSAPEVEPAAPAPEETPPPAEPAPVAAPEKVADAPAPPAPEVKPAAPAPEGVLSPVPLQAVPVAPETVDNPPVSPAPLKALPVAPQVMPDSPAPVEPLPMVPVEPLPMVPIEPLPAAETLQAIPVIPEAPVPEAPEVPEAPVVPAASPVNDTARFLAGLEPERAPFLIDLAGERTWKHHAAQLNKAWQGLEKGRLTKVRTWSATHIPAAASTQGTMFYMFSGPDFLYADAIYPGATTYVFCGVEPVGPIPDLQDLRRDQIPGELESLRSSLDSVLSFSFFITKEMKKDLYNHSLKGALPIISIFMARADKTICGMEYVGLDEDGVLSSIDEPKRQGPVTAPGVKITFHNPGCEVPRTLYYFSTDISDSGLKSTGFMKFCKGLAPGNSLVKSASYLMHKSYFSTVRSFLLENSETLVQDDSGIPVAYFPPTDWELRLFGRYPGPIPLFKEHTQRKLHELYRDANPVPLDFGIGYRHRKGESMLMVAKFRTATEIKDAPKAVLLEAAPPEVPETVPVAAPPREAPEERPEQPPVAGPSVEPPAPATPPVAPVADASREVSTSGTVQAGDPGPGAASGPAAESVPLPQ